MKVKLTQITIKTYIPQTHISEHGKEILCVHPTAEAASLVVNAGRRQDDDQLMSTTHWHRHATKKDVEKMKYFDADADEVNIELF